jgi:hypothetical protein
MGEAIARFLTPVIEELGALGGEYSAAHGEVAGASASQTPGWFGGDGSGVVRAVCGSFLDELARQVELLAADQAALATSLTGYRAKLQKHMKWAGTTTRNTPKGFGRSTASSKRGGGSRGAASRP